MNSISDTFNYKNVCKLAVENDNVFSNFKRHTDYTPILEHVDYNTGLGYLNYIKKYDLDIFNKIKTELCINDKIGNPVIYEYPDIGNISPTTLRYIKNVVDLKRLYGNFNNKKIIEIGCGYGGQCLILSKLFDIDEYTVIDLDEPLALTKKYLSEHNLNINILSINDVPNYVKSNDIVISTYAYSEISKEIQTDYYNYIIKNCKHGYFILNFISDQYKITSLNKEEIISLFEPKVNFLKEYPNTHPNNVVMYF